MDIRKVKKLIELLEESSISEIEVKEGDDTVRISRASSITPPLATPQTISLPVATQNVQQVGSEQPAGDERKASSSSAHDVEAPMVGLSIDRHRRILPPLWKSEPRLRKGSLYAS